MSSPIRQLAAIMFTDIVGYTALMGKDSQKALKTLDVSKSFQKTLVEQHNGKWLKEMGDGVLVSFGSALDAVNCAIDIQKSARAELDEKLRIGIHLGDVTVEKDDVHGDGVNVASRLETVADPGGIYISEAIHNAIQGQSDIQSQFLGELNLRNVVYPVRSYAIHGIGLPSPKKKVTPINKSKPLGILALFIVIALGTVYYFMFWKDIPEESVVSNNLEMDSKSIAVLPFTDMSPEGDQEYLGDGIAEEILNVLVKIKDLKVIGRTSSFSYKGQNKDLKTIGKELGVGTILEGSVRKNENLLRVTAQLIDTRDGSHLWSETYHKELADIFTIQDEIANRIVEKFRLTLSLSIERKPPTSSIDAYEWYLKGRQYSEQGLSGTLRAIEHFEKAVELDPDFLLAHALLSQEYWAAGLYGLGNRNQLNKKARNEAYRTLEIDPDSPHGYDVVGWINFSVDWDWDAALKNTQKAYEMGKSIKSQYPYVYAGVYGGNEKSISIVQEYLTNDPLSVTLLLDLSRMYYSARQYENVLENGKKILELKPSNTSVRRHLGLANIFLGNFAMAEKYYGELIRKDSTYAPHGYVGALMGLGRADEAREVFDNVKHSITAAKKVMSYIYLNEFDSAFKYLDVAYAEKDAFMCFIKVEPEFDLIRNDPRFDELLVRMGLDKYKK